jgi:hypothetical protein
MGIHLENAIAEEGTKVIICDMYDGKDTSTQQEWIVEGSNIVSKKDTNLCLHIKDGKDANGTHIVVWTGKDAPNGSWSIRHVKDVVYRCVIISQLYPSKSIHVDSTATGDRRLFLSDLAYTSTPNQEWIFDGPFIKTATSPMMGIHLQDANAEKGTNVIIHDMYDGKNTSTQQEWIVEGSNIVSKKNTNLCLHISEGNNANGTPIVVWTGKDAPNGSWIIRRVKDVYAHKVGEQ